MSLSGCPIITRTSSKERLEGAPVQPLRQLATILLLNAFQVPFGILDLIGDNFLLSSDGVDDILHSKRQLALKAVPPALTATLVRAAPQILEPGCCKASAMVNYVIMQRHCIEEA